jgi:hypothetical protein
VIDWKKHFPNPLKDKRYDYVDQQLTLLYQCNPAWTGKRLVKVYAAGLSNLVADPLILPEYYPSGNRYTVSVARIMSDVMGDLSMMPFPPAERRVVILYNPDELFTRQEAASDEEKTPKRRKAGGKGFGEVLKSQLGATKNVLMVIGVEDYERNRRIDRRSALYKLAAQEGTVEQYEEKPMVWEFNDAFLTRDTGRCVEALRAWLRAVKQPQPIFFNLVRQVEMLTQARLLARLEPQLAGEQLEHYFPREMAPNVRLESDARQRLLVERARNFSYTELLDAMERLLQLNVYVFPTREDPYVPDVQVLLERFLVETLEPG